MYIILYPSVFYTSALSGTILWWLEKGFPIDENILAQTLIHLIGLNYKNFFT